MQGRRKANSLGHGHAPQKYAEKQSGGSISSKSSNGSARIEGWRNVEFETDCKVMVDKLGEETAVDAQLCTIIKDSIKQLSLAFDKCCFSFTKRENNHVSRRLAKLETVWKTDFPAWLTEAAKADIEEQLLKVVCLTIFNQRNAAAFDQKKKKKQSHLGKPGELGKLQISQRTCTFKTSLNGGHLCTDA